MAVLLPRVREHAGGLRLAGFIDVETTGLDPARDEVVEFAISLFAFSPQTGEIAGIVEQYAGLRDPGRPIPKGATAVHGIRDADVRGKRLNDRMIRSLMNRSEFLIAHNAAFDRPFVERLYPEAAAKPWLCSMTGVPWKSLGFPSRGLQNLLKAHGIHPGRAHRGMDDVQAALALLATKGQDGSQYFRYLWERYREIEAATAPETGAAAPGRIAWLRWLLAKAAIRGRCARWIESRRERRAAGGCFGRTGRPGERAAGRQGGSGRGIASFVENSGRSRS